MTPDFPAPTEQALLSCRYIADARCIIPTSDPDLWGVFVGFSAERKLVGILTTEELLASFHTDWTAAVVRYNTPRPVRVPTVSTAALDDILADLTFDL